MTGSLPTLITTARGGLAGVLTETTTKYMLLKQGNENEGRKKS